MLFPLVVLAVLSVIGGAMQLPFSKNLHFLEHWLAPVVEESEADIHNTWAYENKYILLGIAIVVAVSAELPIIIVTAAAVIFIFCSALSGAIAFGGLLGMPATYHH